MISGLTTIIRSSGRRTKEIFRAIQSAHSQVNIDVTVVVVLNGLDIRPDLPKALSELPNVRVEVHKEYDLWDATRRGRELVKTEFFCYLDDDDEFIENKLQLPCRYLREHSNTDVVVFNGYNRKQGESSKLLNHSPIDLTVDPLIKLFNKNWLTSCGAVYRTSSVGERYFETRLKFYEWTMVAFLLSLDKAIYYLHEPIFVINYSQGSLSDSDEYTESTPIFLSLLSNYPIPKRIKRIIDMKLSASLHHLSEVSLNRGEYYKAWKYHLKSIVSSFQGLKYIPFTRKLL